MKENNKDKLKSFVDQHRDDFDQFDPPPMDFTSMGNSEAPDENNSQKVRMIPLYAVLRVASILVVLIAVGGIWMYSSLSANVEMASAEKKIEEPKESPLVQPKEEFQLAQVSDEMAELEGYYVQQVSLRINELEKLGIGDEMKEELDILDAEFSALKLEIGTDVDNEQIVSEMIKNYKLKLDLLQKVLDSMSELNETDKVLNLEEDEKKYTVYM